MSNLLNFFLLLPAVLKSSQFVQNKYSKSIETIGVGSKNFPSNHTWLEEENGEILSPYNLLRPLFENFSEAEIANTLSEMYNINDGGAALTAYGKIQYTDMTKEERQEISKACLLYTSDAADE